MSSPRVVQVTSGRFHQFDLARQLERRGLLEAIYTGYPRWKLRNEALPPEKVRTFPWLQPFVAGERIRHWNRLLIDRHAARTMKPMPDLLIAMSGHGSASGRRVQEAGGAWICVRGSTHARHQQDVLQKEYRRWNVPYRGPPEEALEREEHEYAAADRIAVPSGQVRESFLERGVAPERLLLAPYGVDLDRFYPVAAPATGEFDVLSAGAITVRKGIGHLLRAFGMVRHPGKRLILAGSSGPEAASLLGDASERVVLPGHVSQPQLRHLMSRSHVFALCSVEEGLANVMGQALACGCPVVATAATGAADLFADGVEGFIVARPDPALIAERLEQLAGDPALRQRMSEAALRRVAAIGGWNRYGNIMETAIRGLARREKGS